MPNAERRNEMGYLKGWYKVNSKMYQPTTQRAWIIDSCKDEWDIWGSTYYFKSQEDAILFALSWS